MWPDQVLNLGHLALDSDMLPTVLCSPATVVREIGKSQRKSANKLRTFAVKDEWQPWDLTKSFRCLWLAYCQDTLIYKLSKL